MALALAPAPAPGFELEEILGFAYPEELVEARESPRIAWVETERGARNLWTAAAPDFLPVRLTDDRRDAGQDLGGLALTADGSILVYVRGGSPNSDCEHPNPTSDPAGAEQAVWAVSTAGGEPWKLGEGSTPLIAPDGGSVLFRRKNEVYEVPLARGEEAPEARLAFKARGSVRSLAWSSDGRRVAFVSDRRDHSFVGVWDREAGTIAWMAPGVDRDMAPAWSLDGRRLAFLRGPGLATDERLWIGDEHPFSILVADPGSGEAREIWRSPGSAGGFAQDFAHPLRWAAGDRLLFTSEQDGWLHVYTIPAAGGEARDLAPAPGLVEQTALDADGRLFFFASNQGDLERRHLWSVDLAAASPEPRRLTRGDGIETDPVVLVGGQFLAYRAATAARPPAVTVLDLETLTPKVVAPRLAASFPADGLAVPETVTFAAPDGLTLHAQVFSPRATGRRPAVVFLHGGPHRQMLPAWHYRHYYAQAYAFNQYLASRGFLVLALNFRTGIGYGKAFRLAPDQGPYGASEYQDVVAAGLYLRGRPDVDPARIGLWGGSYGGYLTAMGLARDPDLFAAGVDLHGVHDWAWRAENFPTKGGWWGIEGEDALAMAKASSPVASLDAWRAPVLLVHGDDDRNVLFAQTVDLARRLRRRGVHVETLVLPDEVHSFLRYGAWLRTYRAAADFFARFLAGAGKEAPAAGAGGDPDAP